MNPTRLIFRRAATTTSAHFKVVGPKMMGPTRRSYSSSCFVSLATPLATFSSSRNNTSKRLKPQQQQQQQNCRWKSSSSLSSEANQPLVVVLDAGDKETETWRPPLLWPTTLDPKTIAQQPSMSVDQALEVIHQHYSNEDQFVGGMGESDAGVILATTTTASPNTDLLDCLDPVTSLIQQVKQERHGVPFLLQTAGIPSESVVVDWAAWQGLGTWQVSLYAASPPKYQQATGGSAAAAAAFGQVCQFLIEAHEHGMAVEATVVASQAAEGRDLALSLGAQQVHVVPHA